MTRPKNFPKCANIYSSLTLFYFFHAFVLIIFSVSHFWKHNYILYSAISVHSVLSIYLHLGFETSTAIRGFIINKLVTNNYLLTSTRGLVIQRDSSEENEKQSQVCLFSICLSVYFIMYKIMQELSSTQQGSLEKHWTYSLQ